MFFDPNRLIPYWRFEVLSDRFIFKDTVDLYRGGNVFKEIKWEALNTKNL